MRRFLFSTPRTLTLALALVCATGMLLLSGCSFLDPGAPLSQVLASPKLPGKNDGPPITREVTIMLPLTGDDLNSDRMAVLINGFEVRYLDGMKWTSATPWMMQRLLLESLESTRALAAVSEEGSNLISDVRLAVDIKRFYLRYDTPDATPKVEIVMNARLMDMAASTMLGTTTISALQECAGSGTQHIVAAYNLALTKVLADSSDWVLSTLRAKQPQDMNTREGKRP